jgi:hypothetical protein
LSIHGVSASVRRDDSMARSAIECLYAPPWLARDTIASLTVCSECDGERVVAVGVGVGTDFAPCPRCRPTANAAAGWGTG